MSAEPGAASPGAASGDAPVAIAAVASAAATAPIGASSPLPRSVFYQRLLASASHQLASAPSRDPFALLANIAALVYHSFHATYGATASVNWSGFYLLRQVAPFSSSNPIGHPAPPQVLLLGPFHGQPAVSLIRVGKGVCGSAVAARATQVVPDVHQHPNHIACDSASQSEIVCPIYSDAGADESPSATASSQSRLVGVLDIDSPTLGFFTPEEDQLPLEQLCRMVGAKADWTMLTAPIVVELPADDVCPMTKPIGKAKAKAAAH